MKSYLQFRKDYAKDIKELKLTDVQAWDAYGMYQDDPEEFDPGMMQEIAQDKVYQFKAGDLVHFFHGENVPEKGIIKLIKNRVIWVVYNCAGDWDNYRDYTGVITNPCHLFPGWPGESEV